MHHCNFFDANKINFTQENPNYEIHNIRSHHPLKKLVENGLTVALIYSEGNPNYDSTASFTNFAVELSGAFSACWTTFRS